ncbi:MAG TPA: hypothetical protein VJU84_15425 [Pyrinomonadaceae bacterium]|nr:hypothetical protein [Pyrinomonadaceae bacterium]
MPDPLSLALVGSLALTEGIKFFYGQVSKILERRAARKDAQQKEASVPKTEPANVQLPASAFQGQLSSPQIDFDEVERQHDALLALRGRLVNYAEGLATANPDNKELIADVDNMREILESIYKQRISFKGEHRETSGTIITTDLKVNKDVRGKLTGTRVNKAKGGDIRTRVEIGGDVTDDADVVGTEIGTTEEPHTDPE